MDSLDGTSFDSGSSAAALGSGPGSSSDATSPHVQASWGQAMADAGADGGSSTGDTGWDNTGSPWDTGATAAASVPSEGTASSQAAEPSAQDGASDAQATAAGDDARAAQASQDAQAILRGMDDRQAAGPSSMGTQLACLEDACIVEGGAALALRYGVPLIAGAIMAPRSPSQPNTAAPAPDEGGSAPPLPSGAPDAGQQAAPAALSNLSNARVDPGPLALPGANSLGPAPAAAADGAGTTQVRLGLTPPGPQDHVLADPILPQGFQVEGYSAPDLGLPPHTGLPIPDQPQAPISTGSPPPNVNLGDLREGFSTLGPQGPSILESRGDPGLTRPTGPIGGVPTGPRSTSPEDATPDKKAQVDSENQFADGLAAAGYRVVQNPTESSNPPLTPERMIKEGLNPSKDPDLLIEDRVFDTYTPETDRLSGIRDRMEEKVTDGQTQRETVDLRNTTQTEASLRAYLRTNPIHGLKEVIVRTNKGFGRPFRP